MNPLEKFSARPAAVNNPDTTNTDSAYWEDVLNSHSLAENRGLEDGRLIFVGTQNNLVGIEEEQAGIQLLHKDGVIIKEGIRFYKGGRRVTPKGRGSDY